MPQVLLLFDLDQALPLQQLQDDNSLQKDIAAVKHVCLRQLASFCRNIHEKKRDVVQFAFRFYSSTGYFVPPPYVEMSSGRCTFEEFSQSSFDKLSMALSESFEKLLEKSKTNSFTSEALNQHIWSKGRKSEAEQLASALNDATVSFDWDSPNLLSPIKTSATGKTEPHHCDNIIYVFTKLPSTSSELNNFFSPGCCSRVKWKARNIHQELFGKVQNVIGLLQKGDADVALKLIDTSSLYSGDEATKDVKDLLRNSLKFLRRGCLLPFGELAQEAACHASACFEDWFIPEQKPFKAIIEQLKEQEQKRRIPSPLLKLLQESWREKALSAHSSKPYKRKASITSQPRTKKEKLSHRVSSSNVSSTKAGSLLTSSSGSSSCPSVAASRGKDMLRLVRQSSISTETCKRQSTADTEFSVTNRHQLTVLRDELEEMLKEVVGNDKNSLLQKLMGLQRDALGNDKTDMALAALAEATIDSLQKHIQINEKLEESATDIMEKSFLVTPAIIGKRRTSLSKDGRFRDHKLQVLYRFELHRLATSPFKKMDLEEQIVMHLRQISIWDSDPPNKILHFMQESLLPLYADRQHELVSSLYDELNLNKPSELLALLSPHDSSQRSSHEPTSLGSVSAEASCCSKLEKSSNDENSDLLNLISQKQRDKMEKLKKRLQGFDGKSQHRQINLKSKKRGKKHVAKAITASRIKIHRIPRGKTTEATGILWRTPMKPNNKAKRNLSFDAVAVRRSSPRKQLHARVNLLPATPKNFTPRKTHEVLVPETPVEKITRRCHSYQPEIVTESPDVTFSKLSCTPPNIAKLRESFRDGIIATE